MNLVRALRLSQNASVALVGSGGKTTALFLLARQFPAPVIVSVTTHLGIQQARLADRHYIVRRVGDLKAVEDLTSPEVILITGDINQEGRLAGLSLDLMDSLFGITKEKNIPLLIEADGARQKPLKAPADHEPVIPKFVDTVVVIAGLSGLGKPLTSDWIHRPERFADISGLKVGNTITLDALERVLTSPVGGLKCIPQGSRRVVLLNQADSPDTQAQAKRLSEPLLRHYASVCVATLESSNEFQAGFDVDGSTPQVIHAVHERIAGIILAGGSSQRFGKPKQILTWRGKPFVEQVISTAMAAGLSPVILVTGAYHDQMVGLVDEHVTQVIHNLDWEKGQSTSVKASLRVLDSETGAAIFLLVDQPHITETLIRTLVEVHSTTLHPIVAPLVKGQRATPVLFDRETFQDFDQLEGDQGGRMLFARYPVNWVEWHDESILLDVDTPEDYQRLLELE